MTRPLDRALGRSAPAGEDAFATRAFGTTKATAAAIAAAAAAAPGSTAVAGTTGSAAGSGSNMTSSTYGGTAREADVGSRL